MRVRIKGKGPHGAILGEGGEYRRSRGSIVRVAKNLRKQMTEAEAILWKCLRGKKLNGYKFYRQVPIDRFIVDFYCPEKKLVVEVDGSIHEEKDVAEHDKDRDETFRDKGLRVLHIPNQEIFYDLPRVCDRIVKECARYQS
jgi:Uncharacterized protein conserved in bacteria